MHVGPRLLLAGVCSLTLFIGLGRAALWEPDEPRFAAATHDMIDRGDFVTPWFNGAPRFEKPILFYWLQLPFFAVLGSGELAARLPVALAGAGCVALTGAIGARLFGTQAAWLGALVLATSLRFVAFARQGLTDVPALLFELLALHGFIRGRHDASARRAWIAAWSGVGLAALTKGPVAIVPVAVWMAYLVVARDWTGLQAMRIGPGLALATAISIPWYGYMLLAHGRAFADVAFVQEIVGRVEGVVGPSRDQLYYFTTWPADLMPWTPLFLLSLAYLLMRWRRLDAPAARGALLAVVWFAVVLGIFSVSKSKLPHYLLPAYPAAALLVGLLVERAGTDVLARRLFWVGSALIALVLLGGAPLVWMLLRRAIDPARPIAVFVLPLVLATGAAAAVWLGLRRGPAAASTAIAVTVACALAYAAVVSPRLRGLEPLRPLGDIIAARAHGNARVAQLGEVVSAGLVYYSHHRVDVLGSRNDVVRFLSGPGEAFCVLPQVDAEAVLAHAAGTVHELARQPRLVVRFDRLFGDRSPFEGGLVLVSNQSPAAPP